MPARGPLVGAVRWDAWYHAGSETEEAVEGSLGPAEYHYRLPFFARVLGPNQVQIRGDSPRVIEWEIAFAKTARLDYWAFVWYEPDSPMSRALRWYLASPHRNDVHFAMVTEAARWGMPQNYRTRNAWLMELIAQPTYQTVLGGRPLLYLGFVDDRRLRATWGSRQAFRQAIDAFRAVVVQSGRKSPYIVCMDSEPRRAQELAQALGLDAISAYACPGGAEAGAPFVESRKKVHALWEASRRTGASVVPLVSCGWDPRPRLDHPVPWTKYANRNHYDVASPQPIADHLGEALEWTATHRATTPANTVVINAWNENDEGAWLNPTLNPDGGANTARIDAVGRLLAGWKQPERTSR
jgi:hypothetical protein